MKDKRTAAEAGRGKAPRSSGSRIESTSQPRLYTEYDAIQYARKRGTAAALRAHKASQRQKKEERGEAR
jgi:hypothetical protein